MGVNVNDTNKEISTATTTVIPNSKKKRPTMPRINATGTKTAQMVMVAAITARPISLVATDTPRAPVFPIST